MFSLSLSSPHVPSVLSGGVLFALLSLPAANQFTNRVVAGAAGACPTMHTRVVHTLLFMLALALMVSQFGRQYVPALGKMAVAGLLCGLLFFFLASPDVYRLTNMLVRLSPDAACPRLSHIFLHALVFMAVVHVMLCHAQ